MRQESTTTSTVWQRTRSRIGGGLAAVCAALLAACGSSPVSSPEASAQRQPAPSASRATNAKDYRQDAARHLYQRNEQRIYLGKLPPMLYAIGVLEVQLQPSGHVRSLNWLRAPRHAPEVIAEIERTVHAAAPYPAPIGVRGKLSYTDTWLWDRSGHFQLDTLTEGQRSN